MAHDRSNGLLAAVPRDLVHVIKPHAGQIAAAIVDEVRAAVPEYAGRPDSERGQVMADTVKRAVTACMDCLGDPATHSQTGAAIMHRRGAQEFSNGHSTDPMQAAARVGGRIAWRYLAPLLLRHGLPLEKLSLAAEVIFAYIDELSAAAVNGYLEAQARAAGVSELRKRQLLELIITAPNSAQSSITGLASAVGWRVPAAVTMIALEQTDEAASFPVNMLDDDVLIDLESDAPHLLTGDVQRHVAELGGSLRGWRIAVSPRVSLAEAPSALRMARRTLRLVEPAEHGATVWCEEYLAELWLRSEDFLAAELATRSLSPLSGLTDKQHDRLCQTLLTWLETRGGAPEIARRLVLHPQTVRARMHQLDDLFGAALGDPDQRHAMHLALLARKARQHRPRRPDTVT